MEQVKKTWETFIDFLLTYDSQKISQLVEQLKFEEVLRNPYVWLIGLPILGYLVVRKRFKALLLVLSLVAFLYLLQITFPQSAQAIPLDKLLRFIGGCVALGVLNLYFLFVRQD